MAVSTIEAAPPLLLTHPERLVTLISLVHASADLLVLALYLPFLGVALEVPVVRPFRSRRAGMGFAALGVLGLGAIALYPRAFVGEAIPVGGGEPVEWLFGWAPAWQLLALGLVAMYTLGIVASLSALRRAERRGPAAGSRVRVGESYRKLQVYEAALESAYQEGGISQRERSMLSSIAASLAIHPDDAERLERDVSAGSPGQPVGE